MRVVFAGSRSLPLTAMVAQNVLARLVEYDRPGEPPLILLRRPTDRPLRPFEALVASLAKTLGYDIETRSPGPGGRKATFVRDVDLVAAADEVVAFFSEKDEMDGGTGHVVEKALDQGRTVRAYTIVDGESRLIGSWDEVKL